MFEVCFEDVDKLRIISVMMHDEPNPHYMAFSADFILLHNVFPWLKIHVTGGLTTRGNYHFDMKPQNSQDIMSTAAILRIEKALIEIMDDLIDLALNRYC